MNTPKTEITDALEQDIRAGIAKLTEQGGESISVGEHGMVLTVKRSQADIDRRNVSTYLGHFTDETAGIEYILYAS